MWECPDFFELDGKQVLMAGPMEMHARDEYHNGHCVIALIGSYDPETCRFTRESVQLMDEGIDFYATQTLLAPDGRRIMTAWMQAWAGISDKPHGAKWFGQTICPRELHIRDGRIIQTPVRELDAHRRPGGRPDPDRHPRGGLPHLHRQAGRGRRPLHHPHL